VQRELRLQMTQPEAFDVNAYLATIERVAAEAAASARL
jgi:hypothetical protein